MYASRTHSQLQHVVRELKMAVEGAASYDPAICVLGSRDQMCVHPEVSELRGVRQKAVCKAHVAHRSCNYFEGVEAFMRRVRPSAIYDIEDLGQLGKRDVVCPFYAARELQANADVVFLPYNYLIDKTVRRSLETNLDLAGSVVIFDEAHNLEGLCSDASSMDLHSTDLQNAVREVETVHRMMGSSADVDAQCSAEELDVLKGLLESIVRELDAVVLPAADGLTRDGQWALEFFEKATGGQLNFDTRDSLLELIDRVVSTLSSASDVSQNQDTLAVAKVAETISLVFQASSREESLRHCQFYKVHVHHDPNMKAPRRNFNEFAPVRSSRPKGGRIFGYWCFNPGLSMTSLREYGIRSVILASGTLSPLPSFAAELQTDFAVTLENPHVISPSQIFVGVLQKGPSSVTLNSSYRTRSDPQYLTDLGNSIVNFSRLFRGGLLVFFPSYAVMESCVEFWTSRPDAQGSTIHDRISQNKHVVVEPRKTAEFQACMDRYYDHVKRSRGSDKGGGAVFFAVCRGKVSEGLDFADDNGRAVIITGIPYAAAMDPKVKLKKEYQTRASAAHRGGGAVRPINGEEWYKQQALRAVNQAIGRVVRHKDDFGAILLCDERFGGQVQHLSKWLRPYVKKFSKYGEAYGSLIKFFKSKPDTAAKVGQPRREPDGCGPRADGCGCAQPGASSAPDPVRPAAARPARPPQPPPSLLDVLSRPASAAPRAAARKRGAEPARGRPLPARDTTAQPATNRRREPLPSASPAPGSSAQPQQGAALVALAKSIMNADQFGRLRSLVSQVRDKKLGSKQFCEQVVALISVVDAQPAEKMDLCKKLANTIPASYKADYNAAAASLLGGAAVRSEPAEASGAEAPSGTAGDAASSQPPHRAAASAQPQKQRQGSKLFMLQARGILSQSQLTEFKSILLRVKQGTLPKADMHLHVLRIFDQVPESVERAMLMRNFSEFVTGEHRSRYELELARRGGPSGAGAASTGAASAGAASAGAPVAAAKGSAAVPVRRKRAAYDVLGGSGRSAKRGHRAGKSHAPQPAAVQSLAPEHARGAAVSPPAAAVVAATAHVGPVCQICGERRQLHAARCSHAACLPCWTRWYVLPVLCVRRQTL